MPTIDLLLCCIMFLLVTAVWNRMGRLEVDQQAAAGPSMDMPSDERIVVYLQITEGGFLLGSSAGDQVEIPDDLTALHERLAERQRAAPAQRDLVVAPDDGISYEHVIAAVDTAVTAGFTGVSLSDHAPR